jgi:thiol:disulfide interchange protein DsbD
MHFLLMLSLAFAGGIVLNLMPCVLPVLSLKIFDFVQRAGNKRGRVLAHGLVFTAGTTISFWVLAGLLLLLRRGGRGLGWGYQLQSPSFLVILCAIFFFFSLHLFGVFEVGYLFTRLRRGHEREGLSGSFLSGVTATLVATPCTGPFMGTAMAYAFTQSAAASFLVFTALALGVSFPYLLLSASPGLLRYLPRPGPWMENLKQFMGFPLLATVIWLAWVFGRQTDIDAMASLLGLLLAAGISAWVLGKWMALHHPGHIRLTAALVALVIFVPSLAFTLYRVQHRIPMTAFIAKTPEAGDANRIPWEPFSPARLSALLAAGKSVFIDFTADWCLTCKVNDNVALNRAEVARRFAEKGVVALKADWTHSDPVITNALAGYGRGSIPLYVFYSGRNPGEYHILPQVLTPSIVIETLDKMVP